MAKFIGQTGLVYLWGKIKAGFASTTHTHGNISNSGALQSTDITISNGDKLIVTDTSDSGKVARTSIAFDGSTTTKALTPKGTFETFLQEHQDISSKAGINSPALTGTPTAPTASAGTNTTQIATTAFVQTALSGQVHGNITSSGALQTTDITIASGDKLVVTDASDSNKVARTSVSFDGSTDTKALTQKGTWETFLQSHQGTSSVVSTSASVSSSCSITGAANSGKTQTIIYTNSSNADITVTVPTTYETPDGAAIELNCPVGGYCEVSYININGTIYARGL